MKALIGVSHHIIGKGRRSACDTVDSSKLYIDIFPPIFYDFVSIVVFIVINILFDLHKIRPKKVKIRAINGGILLS
tara:strand:- start:104 stop:331 length:228 start_codon:yes stop_codon:yes gene_type:complete